MKKTWINLVVLVASIAFLGNCDFFKKDESVKKQETMGVPNAVNTPTGSLSEDVLLTINGKPAITVSQYQDYATALINAQPQLKQLMAFMPNIDYELFQQMVKELVILNWIKENKIDQTADYQKDKKMSTDLIEKQLAVKYFQEFYPKHHNVQVSDVEARKAYDEQKKTIPQLTISRGGVNGKMVVFDKQADAQDFLAKVKQPGAHFDSLAKAQNEPVKNLASVNEFSFDVDPQIKDKLTAMKKFTSYDLIKTKDNKYAVVMATGKEEAKYVPFEEVRDAFKQQLLSQKLFSDELDKVQKTMNVVENKAYFDKIQAKREEERDKMQKTMQADQAKSVQVEKKSSTTQKSMPKAPVKGM